VSSTVAAGRIAAIDTGAAERADGVLAVITRLNAPQLRYRSVGGRSDEDPPAGARLRVFQKPEVFFSGQPIGVVVAETAEQARHAAAPRRTRTRASSTTRSSCTPRSRPGTAIGSPCTTRRRG